MEPIYNRDGTIWVPSKKDLERFDAIKNQVYSEKRRDPCTLWGDDTILAFLAIVAIIGLMLVDGYAIRHGQPPMIFGR